MKYKIEFNYRYGKDYVYCNEYREYNHLTLTATIAKTNIIAIKECK